MPDPAKVLADFKPEGGPRVIAARVHGVLKSAFTGPPELAKDQKRPENFPDYKAQTDGPANLVVVADSDILADRFWVRVSGLLRPADRDAVQRQRPVRRQPDRHAGRRRRADRAALARRHQPSVHPGEPDAERGGSEVPPDRAGVAEAPGRHREAVAHAAPGAERQRAGQRAGGDHAGAARRDRCRAQGHRRYAPAIARGAVRPEPRHLAAGDRAARVQHRTGAGVAGDRWRSCWASCAAAVARGHGA